MLTAVILPVLLEDLSMPAFQVELHILFLQARCSTEEAACVELTVIAAGDSMTREVCGRHHSSSCSSGEEVGHPMLCGEVQLQRGKIRKELMRGACQAFERVAWIFHSHLEMGTMNNDLRGRLHHDS